MYGFILKKNFCDGWDNLLSLVVTNLIYTVLCIGLVFLGTWTASFNNIFFQLAFDIVAFSITSIILFAYGEVAAKIANFESAHLSDFFKAIPGVIKDAFLFGLLNGCIAWVSAIAISYYFLNGNGSLFNYFLGAMICWIDIFVILAFQWFIPIRSLMHNNFKKCVKKSFLIFFDNKGFTVLTALYNILLLAVSVLLCTFAPFAAGIVLGNTNSLRIRLYKYDYLEEHPELETVSERKHIPWDELIFDDKEALGPRKIKSFLFPWKD